MSTEDWAVFMVVVEEVTAATQRRVGVVFKHDSPCTLVLGSETFKQGGARPAIERNNSGVRTNPADLWCTQGRSLP